MSLERSLALFFLLISMVYGYTAFFVMDASIAPFAKLSPIWPSSFPKLIAVISIASGFVLLFSKDDKEIQASLDKEILKHYKWKQVFVVLAMMIAYAILLRPLGFVFSTVAFLVICSKVLGEKKYILLVTIAILCALGIWYLVQEVLGIYLSPWPWFV